MTQIDVPAIRAINDPEKVRVCIFINNQIVHVPLISLLQQMQQEIDDLKARVTELENG